MPWQFPAVGGHVAPCGGAHVSFVAASPDCGAAASGDVGGEEVPDGVGAVPVWVAAPTGVPPCDELAVPLPIGGSLLPLHATTTRTRPTGAMGTLRFITGLLFALAQCTQSHARRDPDAIPYVARRWRSTGRALAESRSKTARHGAREIVRPGPGLGRVTRGLPRTRAVSGEGSCAAQGRGLRHVLWPDSSGVTAFRKGPDRSPSGARPGTWAAKQANGKLARFREVS
jgi:hypothetical protein